MKTRKLLFVSLLFALILVACGGGGDSAGDPVGVVKNVVEAMGDLDIDEASKYICEARKADLPDMESSFAEFEQMGLDPDEFMDAFNIKWGDMKYEEKSKGDDSAVVYVSGKVSIEFNTDKLKSFFKKAAEAEGEEVSDEDLDMVIGMFTAMGGQESSFEGDVDLIKEDGKWVVCDELDFLDEIDIGF